MQLSGTPLGCKRCQRDFTHKSGLDRERVIGIFPNEESALRLIGAVLMEIDESWTTGNRYLDMTEYLLWRDKHEKAGSDGEDKSKVCSLVGLH